MSTQAGQGTPAMPSEPPLADRGTPSNAIDALRAENERLARLADIALDLVERACREGDPQATVMKVQLRLRLGFGAALAALQELDRRGRLQGLVKTPHLQCCNPAGENLQAGASQGEG